MIEIKFRAWNSVDSMFIEWSTLKASPVLFMNILKSKIKHTQLMQFTGLKDKNGVDIYEGDIVYYKDMKWTVIYCNQSKCPSIKLNENYGMDVKSFCEVDYEINCDLDEALEVIGNIHQNPELLGGK